MAEDISRVPPPFEIRWDAGSGVRVEDEGESESGYGLESSSVKISLSANGPWAPVGVRQLGASSAAAVGVGPNRGTALVVDRRRGCVRAPATLTSLLPFQLEARTVRLTETKHQNENASRENVRKRDGDAADRVDRRGGVRERTLFPVSRVAGTERAARRVLHRAFLPNRVWQTVRVSFYFRYYFRIIIKLTVSFVQLSQVNLALPGRFTPRGVAVGRRVERGPTERRRVRRRVGVVVRGELDPRVAAAAGVRAPGSLRHAATTVAANPGSCRFIFRRRFRRFAFVHCFRHRRRGQSPMDGIDRRVRGGYGRDGREVSAVAARMRRLRLGGRRDSRPRPSPDERRLGN